MRIRLLVLMPLIMFLCTSCLIKQPKEETVYNVTVNKEDTSVTENTENISTIEDNKNSDTDVVIDNYTDETLEFDRLIKEISEQTKE